MRLLAIETSCDDTSAAVLEDGRVLSNVVSSQDLIHAKYGGIVPELAARRHLETIDEAVATALERAGVSLEELDALAVTRGPGLIGSLLVGISVAQGLALATGLPLIGINHLEGHVLSAMVDSDIEFPFAAMVVSGGHTSIYLARALGDYVEVASTRDDSAGEAFDKGAKMLGLGYPGGREIDRLSREGDAGAVKFPRGRVRGDRLAFTFSGLKTAMWDYLRAGEHGRSVADLSASFQEAIVDVLIDRAREAADSFDVRRMAVVGGVSANSRLRGRMTEVAEEEGLHLSFPAMSLCTDNAAMIGFAAHLRLAQGLPGEELSAASRLPLGPRHEGR